MTHITKTHRVPVINLEMNVAYGCNLQCEYCSHLGRFMKGIVPLDELVHWYQSWNHKIQPRNVRIMGGEPLLHPQLETILYETRCHWQDSDIELVTNGLLLPKMNPNVFFALRGTGASVTMSKHFDDPHYNSMFQTGIEILRTHGIDPHLTQSTGFWRKYYRINKQGNAHPYQSDPVKAWQNCYVKYQCITLLDNCLYRCPQLGCYSHAVQHGFVSDDWKIVLGYRPLTPDCTQETLAAFMREEACEQCSICPEEFEYADMYEKLNMFGLPLTRKIFCGDTIHDQT